MDQAGIQPSQRSRKVSDYVLEQTRRRRPRLPGLAGHPFPSLPTPAAGSASTWSAPGPRPKIGRCIERAALREFQLLETLQHPGILRAHSFTEHELGPALIFEHFPQEPSGWTTTLPSAARHAHASDTRSRPVRQIAEIVRYAHDKRVIHRGLSPQSVLSSIPDARTAADQSLQLAGRLSVGKLNWQRLEGTDHRHVHVEQSGGQCQHGLHGSRGPGRSGQHGRALGRFLARGHRLLHLLRQAAGRQWRWN